MYYFQLFGSFCFLYLNISIVIIRKYVCCVVIEVYRENFVKSNRYEVCDKNDENNVLIIKLIIV